MLPARLLMTTAAPLALASIARDSAVNGAFTTGLTYSWSHTCSGTDRILFVAAFASSNVITSITYNLVPMTLISEVEETTSGYLIYLFYLVAPATGANNVTIVGSVSAVIGGFSSSYTGADPTGVPDASTSHAGTPATTFTTTLTTVKNNCWTILWAKASSGTPAAGSGTSQLINAYSDLLGDSNGVITPAGSHSMAVTEAASPTWASIMASFAPA